ncbi:MAG: hypothetical protein ACREDO_07985 [Methyloceanibacter sp.]
MRLSDKELRAALATVIARIGTGPAQRLAEDVLHDRLGDGEGDIFAIAERLDIDGNAFVRDFAREVHDQTGHSIVPIGRLN